MRLEYKYLISNLLLSQLRNDLLPFVLYDKHLAENQKEYTVRSIYFDNRKLDYYYEKIEGLKVRKKLRIRGYNFVEGKNLIFLEIKKKNESYVFKNRAPLNYEDLYKLFESGDIEKFISGKYDEKQNIDDGKRFFYHFINKSLRPVILVIYDREAYTCKFDEKLRITFDKNLRYLPFPALKDLYSDNEAHRVLNNYSIVEIKFRHSIPLWLQNLISKYRITRKSLSKYVICLDDYAGHNPLSNNVRSAFSNNFLPDQHQADQGIIL
jgi:hypothetical protein